MGKTAECKCFDGYEGKGCRRSTCPGNVYATRAGTKIGASTTNTQSAATTSGETVVTQAVPTTTTRTDDVEQYHGFLYDLWDSQKIQGCKCDLGYDGPDCAHRISPKGDDPLTTVKSQMMSQLIQIGRDAGGASTLDSIPQQQFIMVYHDPYGGVWRTDGIDTSSTDSTTAANVQAALRNLPNQVLDGVSVKATSGAATGCVRTDGVQSISAHGTEHIGWHIDSKQVANDCTATTLQTAAATFMDFTVAFADKPGQTGVQYLFEVDVQARGAGSFPVSAGITSGNMKLGSSALAGYPNGYTVVELSQATTGVSELAECSDRGLDNGDGECECFDGFRGLACEEQEALV